MRWPETGQYGLPMYINVYVLWYNRQVFDKSGLAFPMTTGAGTNTRMRCSGLPTARTPSLAVWTRAGAAAIWKIVQNGGTVVDPENDRHATFDSPEAIEAMEWVHARYHQDRSIVHGEEWAALDRAKVQALMQGTLATWEEGSWGPGQYSIDYPENVEDWDVVPAAAGSGGPRHPGLN